MNRNLRFLITAAFAATALAATAVACTTDEGDDDAENNAVNNNNGTNNGTNNPTNNGTNNPTNNGTNNPLPTPYRYVLVEDLSTDVSNTETPGSDIDAIGIDIGSDGVFEHWASGAEDFNIDGANNAYTDVNALLGEPDSDCMVQNFTSLGGMENDGYVIVSFGGETEDVTFGAGDTIFVAELGPTGCEEQTAWKDDPTRVSVSISTDREAFTLVGELGNGANAIILE